MTGSRSPRRVLVALVAIGLGLELAAVALSIVRGPGAASWGGWQSRRADVLRQVQRTAAGEPVGGDPLGTEVIHPYLGFVGDPSVAAGTNEYGFVGTLDPIQRRSAERLIVGVLGGPAAMRLGTEGRELLEGELRSAFPGRDPVVINLARARYKQPQQLMTLSYLLTLGAEFDMIVNVDGSNELALHSAGNATQRIHPIYPAGWYLRASSVPDPRLRRMIGLQVYLESRMQKVAATHSRLPWRWSMVANVVWSERQHRLEAEHRQLVERIRGFSTQGTERHPYWVRGPISTRTRPEQISGFLSTVWSHGSLQLMRLCRENGIRYLHVLQPEPAAGLQHYDRLRELADRLRQLGVELVELSDEHPATVAGAVGRALR